MTGLSVLVAKIL